MAETYAHVIGTTLMHETVPCPPQHGLTAANPLLQDCCCRPGRQEISIDSGGHRTPSSTGPQHGAQQQMRAVSCWQPSWQGWTVNTHTCFYRAMLCIRGTSRGPVSVCLCLSVCVRLCLSQVGVLLKRQNVGSHKQHHSIPPGSLVFWCQRSPRNSTGVTAYEGAECRWGGQNRRLSTNNRLYLENGTR